MNHFFINFFVLLRSTRSQRQDTGCRPVDTQRTDVDGPGYSLVLPNGNTAGCLVCATTYRSSSVILLLELFSCFSMNSVLFLGVASTGLGNIIFLYLVNVAL